MLLGEVIGTVVATQKYEGLEGTKLLLVEQLGPEASPSGNFLVAVDAVGAGKGDIILFATGSSARNTGMTMDKPVDAVIMGIIDSWELRDKRVYDKSSQ